MMKKTLLCKIMTLCFVVSLALSAAAPHIAYAEVDYAANTNAVNDNAASTGETFEDNNSGDNGDNAGEDIPGNTEDNVGNQNSDNIGDNSGDDIADNTGDNTGDDVPDDPKDNPGDDVSDNPGNNPGDDTPDDPKDNPGDNTPGNTKDKKKGIIIQIGKNKKTVETLKGSFVKKKGVKYFKNQNGKLVKNQFFCKGKNIYHVNRKGAASLGWNKIKGHYYFFDRKSGKMIYNAKADKIKITKAGIAKETTQNVERIKVYLKAQKIVQEVSKPDSSKSEKLYKCYRWMAKFPYKRYRTMKEAKVSNPKDWDVIFAYDIFKDHQGCCASEACAFGYLAVACGYENVTICSDTGHAWVDIGGRLYDPLFAECRSFKANYNAKYTDYRIHPAYVKKL